MIASHALQLLLLCFSWPRRAVGRSDGCLVRGIDSAAGGSDLERIGLDARIDCTRTGNIARASDRSVPDPKLIATRTASCQRPTGGRVE